MTSLENAQEALLEIVGSRGVLSGEDVHSRSADPMMTVPTEAEIIVRPADTDELASVVRWCRTQDRQIVVHGGRTGASGGAYARPSDVVISLERMARIEEIDADAGIAVVQAGVTLEALNQTLAEHGLLCPLDLGSKGSATLGGMISTNAGGNHVLRWGMTRYNILGLEVVLSDGTVLSLMNRLIKNNSGYDLKQMFIGSEGTLGIVTRAVVKLVPLPTTQEVAFVSARSFSDVTHLLKLARRMSTLSAFELMWLDYYKLMAASDTGRSPLAADQPYYILIETAGYDDELDQQLFSRFVEAAYDEGVIADAVIATSDRQRQDLWRIREGAEVLGAHIKPYVPFDISIDIGNCEEFAIKARAALEAVYPQVKMVTFGHLGDNNIHLSVHVGPDTRTHKRSIEVIVYDLLKTYHGSISAEHGIGQNKKAYLGNHLASGEFTMMTKIKELLDPSCLLNSEVIF